jgi:hypothetical protein
MTSEGDNRTSFSSNVFLDDSIIIIIMKRKVLIALLKRILNVKKSLTIEL